MKKIIKIFSLLLIFQFFLGFNFLTADASEIISNGKYEVPITKHMKMGSDYLSDNVIVEKQNEHYYMTFSVLDVSAISEMNLILGTDKVGKIERVDGEKVHYTYSLSKENLSKLLTFRVFVNAMKFETEFQIELHLDKAKFLTDTIDDLGERPAEFVPSINISSGTIELKVGSYYQLASPTASLEGEALQVSASIYYLQNGEKQDIEIVNNRFMVENIGEYHVLYRAESNKYQTNYNNNAYSIVDIKIIASLNSSELAKVTTLDGNTIEGIVVQAIKVNKEEDIYKDVKDKLKKIADHFEIITVELYDQKGNLLTPNNNFALYLETNPQFDRNKVRIFYLEDDGNLLELDASGYGRFMKTETNKCGNFIIALNGVEFVMPKWGYAVILILSLLIIISIIIISIVIIKKKHKKKILNN